MYNKDNSIMSFFLLPLFFGAISFVQCSDELYNMRNKKSYHQTLNAFVDNPWVCLNNWANRLERDLLIPAGRTGYEQTKKYIVPAVQVGYEKTKEFIKEKQIECRQGSDSIVRQENESVEQPPREMTTLKNAVNDTVSFASKKFNEKIVSETSLLDEDIQNTITKEFGEVSEDVSVHHRNDIKAYLDKNEGEDDFVERKLVTFEVSMMKVGMAGVIFVGLSWALYKLYEKYCKNNSSNILDEQVE